MSTEPKNTTQALVWELREKIYNTIGKRSLLPVEGVKEDILIDAELKAIILELDKPGTEIDSLIERALLVLKIDSNG